MIVLPTDPFEMIVNRCLGNVSVNQELKVTNVIYVQTERKLSLMDVKDVSKFWLIIYVLFTNEFSLEGSHVLEIYSYYSF